MGLKEWIDRYRKTFVLVFLDASYRSKGHWKKSSENLSLGISGTVAARGKSVGIDSYVSPYLIMVLITLVMAC